MSAGSSVHIRGIYHMISIEMPAIFRKSKRCVSEFCHIILEGGDRKYAKIYISKDASPSWLENDLVSCLVLDL